MNTTSYLNRFNAPEKIEPFLQDLAMLQSLHMEHIPFENLDVIRREPIYLNLESIYEKVVNRRRGGYCYELNGLFHWLLQQLGFNAKLISATIQKPNGQWAKADTHAAILVELDTPYLVDAGFGDSSITPIPLEGERQTDQSGTYKIEQHSDIFYDLIKEQDSKEQVLYRFSTLEKKLADFHEGCIFNQISKDSSFTHDDLVTRATPNGRITLSGRQLTRSEDGKKTKIELTESEKLQMLKSEFGILL